MKKIKTISYLKKAETIPRGPDYNVDPPVDLTQEESSAARTMLDKKKENKEDIKRKWKHPPKVKKEVIYQTGMPVPDTDGFEVE